MSRAFVTAIQELWMIRGALRVPRAPHGAGEAIHGKRADAIRRVGSAYRIT